MGEYMESLWLVGLLVAIVVAGYVVVNIVFKLIGDALTAIGENLLLILIVSAIILVVWLGYHP
jgi:hypothetical protein